MTDAPEKTNPKHPRINDSEELRREVKHDSVRRSNNFNESYSADSSFHAGRKYPFNRPLSPVWEGESSDSSEEPWFKSTPIANGDTVEDISDFESGSSEEEIFDLSVTRQESVLNVSSSSDDEGGSQGKSPPALQRRDTVVYRRPVKKIKLY